MDLKRGMKAKPDQRDEQFLRLRDRIDEIASRKFLAQGSYGCCEVHPSRRRDVRVTPAGPLLVSV